MTEDSRAWKDQYMLRFPEGMRDRLKASAKERGRSLNSEIVSKLQRYDSLGGEVDAMWVVATALAGAIDDASNQASDPLSIKVNDAFASVDEFGHFDRTNLALKFGAEAANRLKGALHLPDALLERVKAKAEKNMRSVEAEAISTLEREYPAPSDVMHVHLDNIRHALDLYERATDPQERMRLQHLVEMMTNSGNALEIDWDEDGEI